MRRNTLLIDAAIALVLAILVIVISGGLAVVGLLALLVVVVCAISFGIDRLRRRRRGNPVNEIRRSRGAETAPRSRRSAALGPKPAAPPRRAQRRR